MRYLPFVIQKEIYFMKTIFVFAILLVGVFAHANEPSQPHKCPQGLCGTIGGACQLSYYFREDHLMFATHGSAIDIPDGINECTSKGLPIICPDGRTQAKVTTDGDLVYSSCK
jgi:hypothetical protein